MTSLVDRLGPDGPDEGPDDPDRPDAGSGGDQAAGRRSVASTAVTALSLAILIGVGVVIGGLAAGYRPIVILTGSMGRAAPPGSLIVAAPADGNAVAVGDILVMRRPDSATVTHRVIEVEGAGATRYAITQGDANEVADAAPYPLAGDQLVARWTLPRVGQWALTAFQPGPVLGLVGLATLVLAAGALRRIWSAPEAPPDAASPLDEPPADPDRQTGPDGETEPDRETGPDGETEPADDRAEPVVASSRRLRPRNLALAAIPAVLLGSAGVALALARATAPVDANAFGTAACFDPELTSVQQGETVHAVNGTVSVPITAVDPTGAFVIASLRSGANEPADATVLVELAGGGTSLDLVRATDAGSPPAVTVSWSVVEYGCGVTVQRGSIAGDGTAQLDVPITTVDTGASFVLVSGAPAPTATGHGANDLFAGELVGPSTVRIRTTGSTFDPAQRFAWQVIEFDDGADVAVQTVATTLGLGATSTTVAIPSPADPETTFLLSSVLSAASGPDIGERLVRTHLVDASTIAVDRSVGGDPVEVRIQVVTLKDGSTVRHGTVDLAAAQPTATVAIDAVDPARSTAFSTVAQPGVVAGGQTDHVVDDVPGEASATFALSDPETVTLTRAATASNASFGWQVVEWAGPGWWDVDLDFRQRIDVATSTAAAPDAYTVPLTLDHAALVASGLARADGDDVRVLRWDGSTWTELDRVLEDGSAWDRVDTTIWFRTTDPIAADTTHTYWLYFGDPAAGSPPADPEVVFLLTENFDAGDLGDFEDRTGGTGWYQALPWTRRIPITVPSGTVAADLADHPLLVQLTSADLAANAQPDGDDIRFTAADGVTPLAHEIEAFDAATGALTAWVLVPTVSAAADTTVHLSYGAADAPDQQDHRATWPAEVRAAWHLARDPAGSAPRLDDATANNHDGLSAGAMVGGDLVAGAAGPAIDFDGVDDHLRADPFDVAGAGALTVSALVRLDGLVGESRVVAKAADGSSRIVELAVGPAGELIGRLSLDGVVAELSAGTVPTGSWHHLAMTWDGAQQRLFLDGVEIGVQPATGRLDADPTMPVTIGGLATGAGPLDGLVDEVRIETVARPAAWLDAVQANLRNPGGFLSIGTPQGGSWFDQGTWSYRKPLLVESDLIPADQTDYPLVLQFTDAELTAAAVDGRDLVVTGADGTTRLDHLVESWDQGSGALTAWVLVPTLSSTVDTELFLYYGNASAVDQAAPEAVFGPDADLVLTGAP